MTVKNVIDRVLILIDEVGEEADYKDSIINAINIVQNNIIEFAKKDIEFNNTKAVKGLIMLPRDLYELIKIEDSDGNAVEFRQYDRNRVKVNQDGNYRIVYYKYLDEVPNEEGYELKIEKVAEECLLYGVASTVSVDTPDLYAVLTNKYNELLMNLNNMVAIADNNSKMIRIDGWWY